MPDKTDSPRHSTSRGRKRKGEWVLWEFWRFRLFSRWKPRWKIIRSYRTKAEAEQVLRKRQREAWHKNCHYRIAKAGEKPRDERDEKWD